MPRIPDQQLERIKREISLPRLAEAAGVVLERVGKDLRGRCCFHAPDDDPSLFIDPAKNVFHCFGCGAKGSVIDWVMRERQLTFRGAVDLLLGDLGELPIPAGYAPRGKEAPGELPAIDPEAEGGELLRQVVAFYAATLRQTPAALGYLRRRGVGSEEAIERFALGYADRRAGLGLPQRHTREGIAVREKLKALGILHPSTGQELFGGSITIPLADASGQVVGLYGRKLRDDGKPPFHRYLAGPHRGLFNLEALREHREVILCESLIDALTFWCAGFQNVTSAFGVNGFTQELREALAAYGTRRVLLAYDRDEAGDAAAAKLAEELIGRGIECFRVLFPRGMDANGYALSVKPAKKSLALAIRQAEWLGKGPAPARQPGALDQATGHWSGAEAGQGVATVAGSKRAAKEEEAAPEGTGGDESEATELAATPVPAPPPPDLAVDVKPEEVVIPIGDRRYRVRGLSKNLSYDTLKVNLFVSRKEGYHVDTFDLYASRHRASFQKAAAIELAIKEEVIKKDLGRVLLVLERLQEEQIKEALEPKAEPVVTMTDAERKEALALLEDPALVDRILEDFRDSGIVGEETNKLLGYIAATSRKTADPLAVIIQSSSAAGKTSLMEAILAMMPEEHRVQYSAMTGQSLFYMGESNLKHKILAIVEEEGAERASYALKLLQSEHELSIASTGKDPATGRLVTHEYRVEGPVMIFLTTTAIDLDEELRNRCFVLTVDESREQTRAIHQLQRQKRTLEGLQARSSRDAILRRHKNAQRLLMALAVRNRFAPQLTFLDTQTRTRRDHERYLTLIDSIALLHQRQREIQRFQNAAGEDVLFLDVEPSDIEIANHLAHRVLGWSLDELPPQTRRLLKLVVEMVSRDCDQLQMDLVDYRFTRRQVREETGWGNTQLKLHLKRLEEMEYLLVHQGGRGLSYVYELVDGIGGDDGRFLPGLLDVEALTEGTEDTVTEKKSGSETEKSGQNANRSGPSRPQVGPKSGGGRNGQASFLAETSAENPWIDSDTAHLDLEKASPRHRGEPATGEGGNAAAGAA